MTFKTKCASEFLHKEWNIPATYTLTKVPINVNTCDKLLQLCNKTMRCNYTKGNPSFCERCIAKVTALNPELQYDKTHH